MAAFADLELQWLQNNGAISNNRMEAWRQFLNLRGCNDGATIDCRNKWLKDQGYTGTTQDMLNQLWEACPTFSGPSPSAWIDSGGYIDLEAWID